MRFYSLNILRVLTDACFMCLQTYPMHSPQLAETLISLITLVTLDGKSRQTLIADICQYFFSALIATILLTFGLKHLSQGTKGPAHCS